MLMIQVLLRTLRNACYATEPACRQQCAVIAGWGDTESGVGSCVQIGIPTIVLLVFFSQYLRHVRTQGHVQ